MLGTRNSRARLALGAAALVAALHATSSAQSAAASDETGPFRGYRGPEEASEHVSGWLATGFAERLDLGSSFGGRPLFALQFGGKAPLPLSERTTIFLLGGLDGRSLCGSESVLAVVDALLATPESLPPNVTFVAIPWASPDGLARRLANGTGDGRNDRPTDLASAVISSPSGPVSGLHIAIC
jgi:hypothetical protein